MSRCRLVLLALPALMLILFLGLATSALAQPALFDAPDTTLAADAPQQPDPHLGQETAVVRSRAARVQLPSLNAELEAMDAEQPASLRLNLFDDADFTWRIRSRRASGRSTVLAGELAGLERGTCVLVQRNGRITGQIQDGEGRTFTISPALQGDADSHVINEIQQNALPAEAEPILVAEGDAPWSFSAAAAAADALPGDDPGFIDVLVVYTSQMAARVADVQGLIELAVAEANLSYEHSGASQRLVLAGIMEAVGYTEPTTGDTFSQALNSLRNGTIPGVQERREALGADAVTLLVRMSSYCGLGYLMTYATSSFASSAFNVVCYSCATGYYSFAHELGHNFGLAHDPYVASSGAAYPYAYGHVDLVDRWRTVMAYNDQCEDDGGPDCTRLAWFSNMYATYGGRPMGVAAAEDNALALDNTAPSTSNFRRKARFALGAGDTALAGPVLDGQGRTFLAAGQHLAGADGSGLQVLDRTSESGYLAAMPQSPSGDLFALAGSRLVRLSADGLTLGWNLDLGAACAAALSGDGGDGAYVGLECGILVAVDGSGHERWRRLLNSAPLAAAPWNNLVLAAEVGGQVEALDNRTGQPRWSCELGESLDAPPSLDSRGLAWLLGAQGTLVGLDAATGEERLRLSLGGTPKGQVLVDEDGSLVIACAAPDTLHRVRVDSQGHMTAHTSASLSQSPTGTGVLAADGRIYLPTDNGVLACEADGATLWRWNAPLPPRGGLAMAAGGELRLAAGSTLYGLRSSSPGPAVSDWPAFGGDAGASFASFAAAPAALTPLVWLPMLLGQ